ncbi:FAD-dependent monooxygenase [Couchioplanes caeruleus]|uniref:FAD-dependent oxidoreductase n=2 Tax=Couchioplanes caeruleus TaxID=56438 RepID=A0A1K0FT88_9ACTN|nr:FAD-dependent monooxygenase [Couchioplanes caeruleus]OJF16029.1 FAD-dependent oxidoreductase [Couchioplanes caeruleus subsp. caeruleus]ROP27886.1 2-polyprenyl-6-methoxyphenol hydroxylase-like FAD-dependent oxidoreductase [Couchioplanes caeruleus]
MKVIICGAGIAGLSLAQRLDASGAEVIVVEKAPAPRTGGYMIDFFGPGYDAAEATGVLPRILERGYRIDEVAYCDTSGNRRAGLRLGRFARAAGGRLVSVMRPDLEQALREQLSARVDVRFASTVTQVDDRTDGVRVTLHDGTTLAADLLVGCDGIHSVVRALVFGPEERYLRYLGLHTAAFSFDDPAVHAAVAGRFCMTDTPQRAMGFYGLRDGRVAVFTVHRTGDPVLPDDAGAALRREYGTLGWLAPRALAACPPSTEVYYDQVAQAVVPAWSRGRVALLGDAAYAVSLLAGQGASLAVAGAYLLGEHLARSASVEAALAAYEGALRPIVLDRQEAARRGVRWFLPATRTELRLRRAALTLARLPLTDRLAATAVVGKPTALVADLAAGRPPASAASTDHR